MCLIVILGNISSLFLYFQNKKFQVLKKLKTYLTITIKHTLFGNTVKHILFGNNSKKYF